MPVAIRWALRRILGVKVSWDYGLALQNAAASLQEPKSGTI